MNDENPILLIVQDDPAFSTVLANIATQCGYEPIIIGNPREFRRTYRDAPPAVIITELFMPDFDGVEMVNWLIEQKSRSQIIMTAKLSPELATPAVLIAEAANLFTVTVLAQPVSMEEIRGALKQVQSIPTV